jgi:hypothetical protein
MIDRKPATSYEADSLKTCCVLALSVFNRCLACLVCYIIIYNKFFFLHKYLISFPLKIVDDKIFSVRFKFTTFRFTRISYFYFFKR